MEKSFYWSDNTLGDGVYSPYLDNEFSDLWRKMFLRDRTIQGYIEDYENELEVTWIGGDAISVNTGAALVDGKFYESDAVQNYSIETPSIATRNDRVVLRKTWSAQTVRIAIVTGTEGAGVPDITQEDGSIWEISLAVITITTAGVLTVTDDRNAARSPFAPNVSGNFEEIETVEGDGSSRIILFDAIPQTYTHLKIIGQGKSLDASLEVSYYMRFNLDLGLNYEYQNMSGINAAAAAASTSGAGQITIGQIPAATSSAGFATISEILIPNYANIDFYKQVLAKTIHMPNSVLADFNLVLTGGQWDDTDAITDVQLITGAGNWKTGSSFTLYGMN